MTFTANSNFGVVSVRTTAHRGNLDSDTELTDGANFNEEFVNRFINLHNTVCKEHPGNTEEIVGDID